MQRTIRNSVWHIIPDSYLQKKVHTVDLLGRTYEYCIAQFAEKEGVGGGEFYTPSSVVKTLVSNMAIEAGRYVVKNGNDPNPGNITEETESELEEFIDYAKIVMGTLGHKVFEPFAPSAESADTEPVLYMEYGKGRASGKRTSDGFVVLKGSTINPTMTKSCPERTIKDRKKYEDKIDSNGILTADVLLSSPSSAAGFVGGASLSGNALWKDAEGKTLKELLEAD